jgi:hypothetical protein
MNWRMEGKLPDGHRLFSTTTEDGINYAIADDSGRTPEDTDDGVLWLDVTRCLVVERDESFNPAREVMFIPLVNMKGERHHAVTNASTILHLANLLKWQVEDKDMKAIYEIN